MLTLDLEAAAGEGTRTLVQRLRGLPRDRASVVDVAPIEPARLLSVPAVERALSESLLRVPAFGMVHGHQEVGTERITRSREIRGRRLGGFADIADIAGIGREFTAGASLVLSNVEAWHRGVAGAVSGLAGAALAEVHAVAILSPSSSQAFSAHVDAEDVLAVQLAGSKLWRQFEKTGGETAPGAVTGHGRPVSSVTLERHMALFVPRGVPHEVMSQGDYSLHVSFTFHPLPISRAAALALELVLKDSAAQTLPALADDREARLPQLIAGLAARLGDLDPTRVLRAVAAPYLDRDDAAPLAGALKRRS